MQKVLHQKVTVLPGGKVEFASPELEAGQTVDVVVLHESRGEGRAVMEILNGGPEHRLFQTPEEVREYLAAVVQPAQFGEDSVTFYIERLSGLRYSQLAAGASLWA